jgi:hypothetical protein
MAKQTSDHDRQAPLGQGLVRAQVGGLSAAIEKKRTVLSHSWSALSRMRLTPHGQQHNVGLNSKNLFHVKQMLHVGPYLFRT